MNNEELLAKVRAALSDRNIKIVHERTGISTTTLYKIANNKYDKRGPVQANVEKLADYLGVER